MPDFDPIFEVEIVQSWVEADEDGTHPFACPLYKFNPHTYDKCKKHEFKRISDVKQHLIRRHALPCHSCSICWSPFKDETSRTHHLRHANCQPRPPPEELSPEEVKNLKSLRGSDPRSHWLAIWNQLFPGAQPPSSPYVKPNQIEEVKDLIYPGVLVAFRTNLPTIMSNDTDFGPIVKSILDSASEFYFHHLPRSRHSTPPPPSQSVPRNDVQKDVIQTATIEQPRQRYGLGNRDIGLGFDLARDEPPKDADISMTLDLDDFGSYEEWM
ncbi:unnamed protein product [Clonostachys rhizophaga]|uniref:C2H2-type domain-containing protein n=1 Tax=Clonostachys rhizophaga TaxID=160324 RepID=A0A9N9VPX9_9HYPO|nr:unnamed protein product [Clonostachys rhizophaga]